MTQSGTQQIQIPAQFVQLLGMKDIQIAMLEEQVRQLQAALTELAEPAVEASTSMNRAARRAMAKAGPVLEPMLNGHEGV